jgi:cytoskeletal protein CcmA (bactofilin family)
MKTFRKLTIISLIGLFLIALPFAVLAANKEFEQSIYVGEDEIIEGNFIKVGNFIDINGTINGDVIVAGNSVTINGPVAGDVIAAGNTVRIKGPVSGSVRVAGSTVEVSAEVEKSVWAVGSTVAIGPEAEVGWDVYSAGANVEIKGPIGRDVWVAGANVLIANEVGNNILASIDTEGHLILSPGAKVGGDLTYKAGSEKQLDLKEGAEVTGEISKKAIVIPAKPDVKKAFGVGGIFFKIISLFSLLVIGLVMITLMPKVILQVKEEMIKRPGPAIGWGLVYLILTPVVAFLLMITIIGLPLGLIIIPLYVISLYISKVIAGFVLGLLLLNNLNRNKKYSGHLVWPLILGLAVLLVIINIPVIGWLVKLLLMLWALGALMQVKREICREFR